MPERYHLISYSEEEELTNRLTQSIRAVLSIVGLVVLLVAGSYTSFNLVSMREGNGWALFGVIWGLAAAGAVFESFMTHRLAFLAPVITSRSAG